MQRAHTSRIGRGLGAASCAFFASAPLGAQTSLQPRLYGTVMSGRNPLADAEVILEGAATRLTDAGGHFQFSDVPQGSVVLTTSLLGYRSRVDTIPVGAVTDVMIPLEKDPIQLEPVVVSVHRAATGIAAFYERRERERGFFITSAEFERDRPHRISEVLRRAPGLRHLCVGADCRTTSRRASPSLVGDEMSGDCPVQVYVDGVPWRTGGWLDHEFSPAEIAAIEIYAGASQIPPRFNSTKGARCGVIVLWTGR